MRENKYKLGDIAFYVSNQFNHIQRRKAYDCFKTKQSIKYEKKHWFNGVHQTSKKMNEIGKLIKKRNIIFITVYIRK